MRAKHYAIPTIVLLALLGLCACNRHPGQTAKALNSTDQASASAPGSANEEPSSTASVDGNGAPSSDAARGAVSNSAFASPAASKPAAENVPVGYGQPSEPLIIPAGTPVTVRLQQRLSSSSAVPGERFEAVVDQPVVVQGRTILPVGTMVSGHVVSARPSGRLRHPGEIALTLDSVLVGQRSVRLVTSTMVARGASHKKRNWSWIGGGTGGGALIGALAAGGKGALIGSGIGAAAGTTTAFVTGKKDVSFGTERTLRFRLHRDVTLAG